MISVAEAAARAGVSEQDIETWGARGLLAIHATPEQRSVDEDQFSDVIETLGWLHLSQTSWDNEDA
jgi:hypothetical protein